MKNLEQGKVKKIQVLIIGLITTFRQQIGRAKANRLTTVFLFLLMCYKIPLSGKEYMDNYIKFYLFLNHMIPLNYFIFSTNVEIKMSLY